MVNDSLGKRFKNAWSVFTSKDSAIDNSFASNVLTYGGSTYRPDRERLRPSVDKSIVAAMYNRIAVDVAAIPIKHVKINQNGRYEETISSGLNNCLSVEANIDQTGRELIFDAVLTMFDKGYVGIVPVDTSVDMLRTGSFDILSLRVGKIVTWFPKKVQLEVYNENSGKTEKVILPKDKVAIVENPFYTVMNQSNSTLKRLIEKLNLLDSIDQQNGSTKLDLLIQLPYQIKTDAKKKQAEERKKSIEDQLTNSKLGIAYIDSTEHVTQLNRSLDNNLVEQINDLSSTLYSQLGVTKEVFDGTADEKVMLNYYNATIEPILSALTDEMIRKFLTKTARSQGQSIEFVRDPFRLVPVNDIADIADKFTRNEIMSSNEMRSVIGMKPVNSPQADELRNKNLNRSVEDSESAEPVYTTDEDEEFEEYY